MQDELKKRAYVERFCFVVACVVAAFTGSGCSNNPANYPEVASVVGTVTLDGKPLEGASITFAPQSGRSSSGVTDSSGRYSLNYTGSIRGATKSEQVMDKATNLMLQDAGLPLTTGTNDTENEPLKPVMKNAVGPQYSGPESILTAEVEPHKNEINFDLVNE